MLIVEILNKWAPQLSKIGLQLRDRLYEHKLESSSRFQFLDRLYRQLPETNEDELQNLMVTALAAYGLASAILYFNCNLILAEQPDLEEKILYLIHLYAHHDRQLDSGPQACQPSVEMKQGLQKLLEMAPDCRDLIFLTYQAEIETAKLQYQSNLSLNDYLMITELKDGFLFQLIGHLLGIKTQNRELFLIGLIAQHIDDLVDMQEDADKGIHTFARQYYQSEQNIDWIIIYLLGQIDLLPGQYGFLKIALIQMVISVGVNSGKITEELSQKIINHCYIKSSTYKDIFQYWGIWILDGRRRT